MSKHILIAVTNTSRWGDHDKPTGLWFGELTHFVHAIEEGGHTWELCSPKGGRIPVDPRSLGWMFMKASDKALHENADFMAKLENTQATADIDAARFDAIFYAGGHGTMWGLPGRVRACSGSQPRSISAVASSPRSATASPVSSTSAAPTGPT